MMSAVEVQRDREEEEEEEHLYLEWMMGLRIHFITPL